ncbi:DUF6233 domain-containing protein [Streptomyces sp. CA-243310]|uniref:DUF6233 domain-containing protein n=1 Tax=Streptomyces sp. CA-243310 TaxID=3240056 RepID=UPI003D89DE22
MRLVPGSSRWRLRSGCARTRPGIGRRWWSGSSSTGIDAAGRSVLVHTGDCPLVSGRSRPATRAQAVEALRDPIARACEICRVDSALGLLDA